VLIVDACAQRAVDEQIAGAAAGLLLGLLATSLMTVYRSPKTGKPASRAGYGYATVWALVIGARAAFSYGSSHWFRSQLGTWMGARRRPRESAYLTERPVRKPVSAQCLTGVSRSRILHFEYSGARG
jgi:hypothetical protein